MTTNNAPFGNEGGGWLSGVLGGATASPVGYEPQRMNSALLYIVDNSASSASASAGGYQVLTLALAAFSLPKVQTSETIIPFLNEQRKYAGGTVYSNLPVRFHDYVNRGVAKILWDWKFKVHDPRTGRKGFKSDYVKQGWIELYPPGLVTGSGSALLGGAAASLLSQSAANAVSAAAQSVNGIVASYDLINLWPSMCDFGDVDMGSDEMVSINAQFSMDKVVPRDGLV